MKREDASQGVIFREQLTLIEKEPFQKKYPAKVGRSLLPLDTQGGPGVLKRKWRMYDRFGIAAMLSPRSSKINLVELSGEEFEATAADFGIGAPFNITEVEQAQFAGVPLDSMKLTACRDGYEDLVDDLIFAGDPDNKIQGLNDHPNIPIYTPGVSAGSGDDTFPNKTIDEILADFRTLRTGVKSTTKQTHEPKLYVMSPERLDLISTLRVSDGGSDRFLLAVLLAAFPGSRFASWDRLSTAGVGGVQRLMALDTDKDVAYLWEPQPFSQYPQFQEGAFTWIVPYKGRFGGVVVRRPLACAYMDGI
jgi:hypothetical protein